MFLMETNDRILLRLERGEEIIARLQEFVQDRQLPNVLFLGTGAVENPVLGIYDGERQKTHRQDFPGAFEVVSLVGSVGWKDGQAAVQAGVTLADPDFQLLGGRLLSATVTATAEIALWPGTVPLHRAVDPQAGISSWKLPHEVQSF